MTIARGPVALRSQLACQSRGRAVSWQMSAPGFRKRRSRSNDFASKGMSAEDVIAVIFDFDDTLTEDSTTRLLTKHGIDVKKFWNQDVKQMVLKDGWDPTLAYLHRLLRLMEDGEIPQYTNEELRAFGAGLKPFPGLRGLFRDLCKITSEQSFEIEFYIISGGLEDIVEGFRLRPEFKAVWGCQLAPETPGGPVKYVKRVITFTEKTRYLFEINKGIDATESAKNPLLVNKDVPSGERRVPFANMIYIGDGLTDIPCFSVVQKQTDDKGKAFGIFRPGEEESERRAWLELIAQKRVTSAHAPKYGPRSELGSLLRIYVKTLCADIKLRKA